MMSYHQHTMRPSMNTTPRKSPSAGSRGSTPNKRGNASPSPNKTSTKPKSKQEWNTYLTDHDRFKITKDEQVRRKQLLISKHNILQDFDQPLDTPSKTNAKSPHSISKAVLTPRQDATSLDLLLDSDGIMSESEREAEVSDALKAEAGTTTPMSSKKGKKKAVSSTKAKKAAANKEAASATAMQRRQVMIAEVMASTYTSDPSQDDDEDDEEDDADFAYQLPKQYPSSPIRQNLESTKFTPSPRRKMGSTSSPKGSFAMSSSTQSRRLTTTQTSSQFITTHDQLADKDVQDMSVEIRMLLQEMKYYEELSGKKKVFDSEELEEIVNDEAFDAKLDQKRVIKFLVQLVCQSMTHLLKSEVEHQDLQSQIALLSAKFDEMSSFLGMKKSSSTSTSTSRYLTPQQAKASSSAIDDATTPQAPISSMKSPSSPNGRVFPTSYVNPYESYFSEDVPPPPPVDESEDENHNNTSSVDHWIEYSKRIGEQEASQAFAAMQMVSSSTQRVSSSYLPGSAQQAAQELLEHEQQFQNIAFTGTSPTDLLFAPTALAGSGLNSVADKKTPPLDYMSAADMASRTYDMYAAKFSEQRPSVSEGEEEDEDRITDSYDAMIERLSYKFATTVKPTQPSQIKMTMTSPELVSKGKIPLKQLGKEEQGTIVIPNSDIPTPLQAPLHPFIARITADDYSQQHFQSDVFDTSKQLFPHSPQRRIYDASLGSY